MYGLLRTYAFIFLVSCLLNPHPVLAQFETISIDTSYPHKCVPRCVVGDGANDSELLGINQILGCANPVANKCYCAATATSVASVVAASITKCASGSCGAGDFSEDVVVIKSIYASYCIAAGYTADVLSAWIPSKTTTATAAPSTTSRVPTSTQVTIVTQTAPSSNSQSSSQVVVQLTSTKWVNNQGSSAPVIRVGSKSDQIAIGAGVGGGLAALLALGITSWLCIRKRRRARILPPPQVEVEASPSDLPPYPEKNVLSSPSSPALLVNELGGGAGLVREIGGRDLHPFPHIERSPPVVVPGDHELPGQNSGTPSMGYTSKSGGTHNRQHWELP